MKMVSVYVQKVLESNFERVIILHINLIVCLQIKIVETLLWTYCSDRSQTSLTFIFYDHIKALSKVQI